MQQSPPFVLASASPARLKLLKTVGINPIVCSSDFNESQISETNPMKLVQILAQCKAEIVAQNYQDCLVLGCDSVLAIDGKIYGKPNSPEQAIARWQIMRNNHGTLYTGHALLDGKKGKTLLSCGVTKVYFADIDDRTIEAYVNTGEPLKCAGSFALEGKGSVLIEKIEGCHSNVIGLSLPLLREMLQKLDYSIQSFWESDKIESIEN
ncbi:putative Maf-like protein [Crocosphaera subtropica ATCC 51142]|uniref:Nucleoside triphosphate pyrophosphatase n=1 Tax=Crocosphaera subtropica (strain ATCC 51142 / BH68) TaxID=43989 RepID=B1WR96_CROS5|nr:nucleoside triphosphate pyrophosphatase [Crocosphaera subtropica]ACB50154.1 putative Maf-like protein [Crocosphaera subtropica ATCC 51142]